MIIDRTRNLSITSNIHSKGRKPSDHNHSTRAVLKQNALASPFIPCLFEIYEFRNLGDAAIQHGLENGCRRGKDAGTTQAVTYK